MGAARRLYLFVVGSISLLVLAAGVFNLVGVVLAEAIGAVEPTLAGDPVAGRDRLSLGIALTAVGAPTFAAHWWLVRRGRRRGNPDAHADRHSPLRALHLAVVSSASLAAAAFALSTLIERAVRALTGLPPYGSTVSEEVALLAVAAPLWWLHLRRRNDDLREDRLTGAAAWLTRLTRYAWLFVGVMVLLLGTSQLIDTLASTLVAPTDVAPDGWREPLAGSLALIGAGAVLAWLHLADARRAVADAESIGEDDRATDVRLAYFGAVVLVALASAGLSVAAALTESGRQLLGVAEAEGMRAILESIVGPMLVAVPFLVAGWLHWRALGREARGRGAEPLAAARRLVLHLAALVGIVFLAVGAARVGGLVLEAILAAVPVDDEVRRDAVWAVAQVIVGAILWLPAWTAIVRRRAAEPLRERRSATARTYLLLVVGGALIAGIPSAVFVVYRVVDPLLGGQAAGLAEDIAIPAASIVVSAVVAAYHARLVVADQRVATPAAGDGDGDWGAMLTLVLRGRGDDLDRAAAMVRDSLPAGVSLEER